jgi:hypothetical protein
MFRHIGILFVEKSKQPFNIQEHRLYSITTQDEEEEELDRHFRLGENNIIRYSP